MTKGLINNNRADFDILRLSMNIPLIFMIEYYMSYLSLNYPASSIYLL